MPLPTEEIEKQVDDLLRKVRRVLPPEAIEEIRPTLTEYIDAASSQASTDNEVTLNKALTIIGDNHKNLEFYVFILTAILIVFFVFVELICIAAIWYKIPNYVPFVGTGTMIFGVLVNFFTKVSAIFLTTKENKLLRK